MFLLLAFAWLAGTSSPVWAQTTEREVEAPGPGTPLKVRVAGAEPDKGAVGARLYASEADFMETVFAEQRAAVDDQGVASFDFGVVPPGDYAMTAYWDENGNGELDTGFMRIPKERVGFSNNAKGRFGPAKWKDASFEVGSEALEITIDLVNARD